MFFHSRNLLLQFLPSKTLSFRQSVWRQFINRCLKSLKTLKTSFYGGFQLNHSCPFKINCAFSKYPTVRFEENECIYVTSVKRPHVWVKIYIVQPKLCIHLSLMNYLKHKSLINLELPLAWCESDVILHHLYRISAHSYTRQCANQRPRGEPFHCGTPSSLESSSVRWKKKQHIWYPCLYFHWPCLQETVN